MATHCTGRGDDGNHCCYVAGKVCDYLECNVDERNFACGLRRELGSWEAVHADPRYAPIAEVMLMGDGLCGDWQPEPGVCCRKGGD
jgi:hypothetical protein